MSAKEKIEKQKIYLNFMATLSFSTHERFSFYETCHTATLQLSSYAGRLVMVVVKVVVTDSGKGGW